MNSSPPSRATRLLSAERALQPLRRLDQQPVADQVAGGVVDVLEVVDVDDHQHGRVAAAVGAPALEIGARPAGRNSRDWAGPVSAS